jgi:UDP-glucuronate 4-epimerase
MSKKAAKGPIFLTGAAGFIGFHMAEALLARGETVVGFDALTPYNDPALKRRRLALLKKHKNFTFKKGDLNDFPALYALVGAVHPKAIIHLAAQAGVRYSILSPQSYVEANVLGTTNLFEAAHAYRVPVVYASSSSIYGERGGSFKEKDRTDSPASIYAATKKSAEVIAATYANLYGVPSIGLRYFTVYGPWIRTDLAMFKFARLLLMGNTVPLFAEGKAKRSFTHVSYVVEGTLKALALLLKEPRGHRVYNLGDEHSVPTRDMLYALAEALAVTPHILLMPPQPGDVLITKASSAKARRDLKLRPAMPLSEGVKEFAAWFRKHRAFLMKLEDMHL